MLTAKLFSTKLVGKFTRTGVSDKYFYLRYRQLFSFHSTVILPNAVAVFVIVFIAYLVHLLLLLMLLYFS